MMRRKHQQYPTRLSARDDDSDSSGFVLSEDQPPRFVEALTRYEILSELGRGGGGIIYKARDHELKRTVAVKVLRREYLDREDIVLRFEQEARIICQLQHPGVAPVFECGVCNDGRPFHSMKLVDGYDLKQLIDADGERDGPPSHALNTFASVCQTIAYTHSQNIVHLDIKPANIMVGKYGEVHVMDWGSARNLDSQGRYRSAGIVRHKLKANADLLRVVGGTLEYIAPEQAQGGSLDKRTDVFSLGATLCHILTKSPAYRAENRKELFRMAANGELEPAHQALRQSRGDPLLIRLAIACLQANPNDRPCDACEVAGVVSTYQDSSLVRYQSDMTRFFELSHDLFCIAALDGYFQRINSNFSKLLGYTDAELLEKPFLAFVHEADQPRTLAAMEDLLGGKPVIRFSNRYRTAHGRYVELEWTAKSIPEEGLIFAVARPRDSA